MPNDSRIGDAGSHGGVLVTGSSSVIDENSPSSRVGDIYACPIHGPNPVVTGSPKTVNTGTPNCRVTSLTACGAVIVTGASKCITD